MSDTLPQVGEHGSVSGSERAALAHAVIRVIDRLSLGRMGDGHVFGRRQRPELANGNIPWWRTYARDVYVEHEGVGYSALIDCNRTDDNRGKPEIALFRPDKPSGAYRIVVEAIPLVDYPRPSWHFMLDSRAPDQDGGPLLTVMSGHPSEDFQPTPDERHELAFLTGVEAELNRLEDLQWSFYLDPADPRSWPPSVDSGQSSG